MAAKSVPPSAEVRECAAFRELAFEALPLAIETVSSVEAEIRARIRSYLASTVAAERDWAVGLSLENTKLIENFARAGIGLVLEKRVSFHHVAGRSVAIAADGLVFDVEDREALVDFLSKLSPQDVQNSLQLRSFLSVLPRRLAGRVLHDYDLGETDGRCDDAFLKLVSVLPDLRLQYARLGLASRFAVMEDLLAFIRSRSLVPCASELRARLGHREACHEVAIALRNLSSAPQGLRAVENYRLLWFSALARLDAVKGTPEGRALLEEALAVLRRHMAEMSRSPAETPEVLAVSDAFGRAKLIHRSVSQRSAA